MELIGLLRDPVSVVALALAIFAARVMFLAMRLKSAAKHPTLADFRALEDAKKSLDAHRESLGAAKHALSANLEAARDTLRYYRVPLTSARTMRHEALEKSMASLKQYKRAYEEALEKERDAIRSAKEQRAFEDTKRTHGRGRPRRARSPRAGMQRT
ncbi:MAG: hypothetical protein ACT4OI_10740 [Methanobacteriota archaeon]